jgi:hypothetical protein
MVLTVFMSIGWLLSMARAYQDPNSWEAGHIIRRDFRADHGDVDEQQKVRGKKKQKDLFLCKNDQPHRLTANRGYKCSVCGASSWNIEKHRNKKKREEQKKLTKINHKEDGLTKHLYVWQKAGVDCWVGKLCTCGHITATNASGMMARWHFNDCPYNFSRFWRESKAVRDAFGMGKKVIRYEKTCVSCGFVDKHKYIVEGDVNDWSIE